MKCEDCGAVFDELDQSKSEYKAGQCPECHSERISEVKLETGKEVITPDMSAQFDMSLMASPSIIAVAEEAEKRMNALIKIKNVALKATNASDWVDENGKPYLQSSGAEKVGRIFGISWRISEPQKQELDAGHYIFTYTGEFALWGSVITAVGSRSSRDPFFKKYRYQDGKERETLPASEIDQGDVKKSAYSNLLANGITRLLGIRNLTYADLEQFAGIKQEAITRVEFKKGGKLPPEQDSKPKADKPRITNPDEPATEAQLTAIRNILTNQLKLTDEFAKHEKVQKILGLPKVPTALTQLTKGQASKVIETLQAELVQS